MTMSDAPVEPDDIALIRSALDGDDDAFAALVSRHKHKVFGIAARFARNSHELDDICQDIFLKIYRNLGKFRADAPFEHWIARISVRMCYDFLKKNRRNRDPISLEQDGRHAFDIAVETDRSLSEAREILDLAMSELKPAERLVITLLELEERSVREIAELTGWSESNVKVRAHRARQALKKILEVTDER